MHQFRCATALRWGCAAATASRLAVPRAANAAPLLGRGRAACTRRPGCQSAPASLAWRRMTTAPGAEQLTGGAGNEEHVQSGGDEGDSDNGGHDEALALAGFFDVSATPAAEISDSIALARPWKTVVDIPANLRKLIARQTRGIKPTRLHHVFGEMCEELAQRTDDNLRKHHPESREMLKRRRAGGRGSRHSRGDSDDNDDDDDDDDDSSSSSDSAPVSDKDLYFPPFVYHPSYTLAYTAYRAPIQYAILRRVLAEVAQRRPGFVPRRVLDFGAGCGVAAWALDDVWPEAVQGYTAIEPSRSMVDMARGLLKDFPGVHFEGSIANFLAPRASSAESSTKAAAASPASPTFDLSIASSLLGELTSDTARAAATKILFDKIQPGGVVVLAEPATPWGLRCIDSARRFLLANYPERSGGGGGDGSVRGTAAAVVAPWIPWDAASSAGSDAKLCTFPQGRPVGIYQPSRRAKFSTTGRTQFAYLVVEKRVKGRPHAFVGASVPRANGEGAGAAAAAAAGAADAVVSPEWAADFIERECGMIVGNPLKKKRHVHLYLCDKHGELHKRTITKRKHGKGEGRAWYRAARKASWGGYWPLTAAEQPLPTSF